MFVYQALKKTYFWRSQLFARRVRDMLLYTSTNFHCLFSNIIRSFKKSIKSKSDFFTLKLFRRNNYFSAYFLYSKQMSSNVLKYFYYHFPNANNTHTHTCDFERKLSSITFSLHLKLKYLTNDQPTLRYIWKFPRKWKLFTLIKCLINSSIKLKHFCNRRTV